MTRKRLVILLISLVGIVTILFLIFALRGVFSDGLTIKDETSSLTTSLSNTDQETIYFGFHIKEEYASTDEILDDIERLEEEYNLYIENCSSEELKEFALIKYNAIKKHFNQKLKKFFPDSQERIKNKEKRFYDYHQNNIDALNNSESGSQEYRRFQTLVKLGERAKKEYEAGDITIDEALGYIGIVAQDPDYLEMLTSS